MPIIAYILLAALGTFLDPAGEHTFNPPYLLIVLNIFFVTGTGLLIAVLSARSYLRHGSVNILLLGCAVMAGGLASLIGGYSATMISANSGVTTHNIDMLLSSSLQFLSAMVTLRMVDHTAPSRRSWMLAISYVLIVLFAASSTVLALTGSLPTFLTPTGPTPLRQAVLGMTLVFFLISSAMLYSQYLKLRSMVLYWYSLALAMFAIGMASLLFQVLNGDLSSWIGRLAQYSGGLYFLLAVISLRRSNGHEKDMSESWTEAFMNDRLESANFFTNMLNAFVYGRVEASPDGSWKDMIILDSNQAFERIAGTDRHAVVGRRLSELSPGLRDDPPQWMSMIGEVAQEGRSFQTVSYVEPLRKWLNISAYSPGKDYFVVIFEDVTQQRRMEESLRESEERHRHLIKYSPTAIFELDLPEGSSSRFKSVNDAMCALTGYSRDELLGMDPSDLLTREGNELFRSRVERMRAREPVEDTIEHDVIIKNGQLLNAVMQTMPMYEGGSLTGEFVIAHDLTERKRIEEELRLSNEELRQFAYVASHDLQEPLRTVSLYASLLEKQRDHVDGEVGDYVHLITESAERMRELISDLQQYTRIDAQNRPFGPVDLNLVMTAVLDDLRVAIEESGAEVQAGHLPTVWADGAQIGRVLQNLIGNAIKFHGAEPPRVQVISSLNGRDWTISVKDNGIGIDRKYAVKLFVLFQRLHSREEYPGTGIGLAISKKIVERHGGRIWLESDGRSGTTFFFTLPTSPPPAE